MINFPETIGYIEIDHTADIAIAVTGNSLESLFIQSLLALKEIAGVKLKPCLDQEKKISLNSNTTESLLVAFLNEVLYFLESGKWPVCQCLCIKKNKIQFSYRLSNCVVDGVELKAVTYNMMKIVEHSGYFSTAIVFDI